MNRIVNAYSRPEHATAHMQPELWAKVNRLLVRKAIAEFAHELLIEPKLISTAKDWSTAKNWNCYTLGNGSPELQYVFQARRLSLDHWLIDPASIEKQLHGRPAPLDALEFIIEFAPLLGIREGMMPVYLDEISSTLYGSAFKHATKALSAAELAEADYQTIETNMMEGHPTFIANNGRIGFDVQDYSRYAPEAASPVTIVWLAVHRDKAAFSCVSDLSYERLLNEELGPNLVRDFDTRLRELGLDPSAYLYMPAHPWQWFNKISMGFAADVANRHIVCLGYGPDEYLAQQSIRTFFNISHPGKRYVKTALSVLNMGFMRGLSPYYMQATPAINEWLGNLIEQDAWLKENGFSIIREVAAIGYRNRYYETALKSDTPYKKMLSALWRESPMSQLQPGQKLMTMASLLHIDTSGDALVVALIDTSGLDAAAWTRHYLKAYLAPLVHCFYAYDLVFMPHGENLILVMEDGIPVRVIMKDIGEEIGIVNGSMELPENISRISYAISDDTKLACIFTDIFDCFFRYLAAILVEKGVLEEEIFWKLVAECIHNYQAEHPEFAEKYQRYDLFAPEFIRNCLNRLQLNNNQQMLDLLDPEKSLQFVGTLENPIAIHAQKARPEA
ncbi:IucA/IucC family protein [Phyllobacterium phragmitis]|uniref:IucA/IucC family protein n=1 Tax=Phyllobacterium phragmitis TaxID=2670329 RepID=A0A2S9IKH7_9HYPH|nr:IucA/IucC family siderophore biosynthesis protein [Phyllobacterium phragmitis]PRD41002.1 IucA/IucC family protein [Phyllobacterium phragmitis]